MSFRSISKNLNIAAYNIFDQFRTGEVGPKPATMHDTLQKLDCHHRLYVIGLVMASPDLHLKEIKYTKLLESLLIFLLSATCLPSMA